MKKFIAIAVTVATVSFGATTAHANGWGGGGWSNSYNANNNQSSGLLNVSPSVRTGDIGLLNNLGVLNNAPILSGNNKGLGILGTGNGATSNAISNRTEFRGRDRGSRHRGRGHRRR